MRVFVPLSEKGRSTEGAPCSRLSVIGGALAACCHRSSRPSGAWFRRATVGGWSVAGRRAALSVLARTSAFTHTALVASVLLWVYPLALFPPLQLSHPAFPHGGRGGNASGYFCPPVGFRRSCSDLRRLAVTQSSRGAGGAQGLRARCWRVGCGFFKARAGALANGASTPGRFLIFLGGRDEKRTPPYRRVPKAHIKYSVIGGCRGGKHLDERSAAKQNRRERVRTLAGRRWRPWRHIYLGDTLCACAFFAATDAWRATGGATRCSRLSGRKKRSALIGLGAPMPVGQGKAVIPHKTEDWAASEKRGNTRELARVTLAERHRHKRQKD